MNIPKKIKIGGHEYTVKIVPQSEMSHPGHMGRFREPYTDILIRDDLAASQKESTLLHELLDGIMNGMYEADVPHGLVCAISDTLFQVLRDNDLDFRGEQFKKSLLIPAEMVGKVQTL